MPNTKFSYLYRDASNYKQHGHVVFKGLPSKTQLARLENAFFEGDGFIAKQVGVPEVFLFDEFDVSNDDHCWHEFESAEETSEEPTTSRTFEDFVKQVEHASKEGWQEFEVSKED